MPSGVFHAPRFAIALILSSTSYAASVTMNFTYGKTTPTAYTDPEVIAMNHFIKRVNLALRPGAYLVDSYPIVKRVPYYLNELRKWHLEELASFQGLVYVVRQQLVCCLAQNGLLLRVITVYRLKGRQGLSLTFQEDATIT